MSRSTTPIRELVSESAIPLDFLTGADGPLAPLFDSLYYTDYVSTVTPDTIAFSIELVVDAEIALALPGLDGFAFVLGSDAIGGTRVTLSASLGPKGSRFSLNDISIGLRFPPSILKPAPAPDAPTYAQIDVRGNLVLDENFDLHIEGFDALALPRSVVANSGIVVSASDVMLDFSRTATLPEITAAGFDDSFMGVFIGEAIVELPESFPALAPEDLVLKKCAIGSGGVSGRLEAHYQPTWDPITRTFSGHGGGALFGVPFGLRDLVIELKQNAFVASDVTGQLLLPYFDELVDVEIGFALDGGLTVKLNGGTGGLLTLTRQDAFKVEIDGLEFDVTGGKFVTKLSGVLTPLAGGLAWPSLRVNALEIDSDGNVHLDGGWLDLRDQYAVDFSGFHIELTKLGFGKTDDGGKWIGFSGGLKLVHGISAGASVEGLRINFYDDGRSPELTLEGVGVEFAIPEVLRFQGKIAYRASDHRFLGAIKLQLEALKLEVDATLVIGIADGETYCGVYLDAELPAGIPLFSTGLALYGMAGLFALEMEPDRHPDEAWYEGYYKRTPVGVTDLDTKWIPRHGSVAFGAGVTVGTVSDNGYAFSGKLLLVIVFPGPIILLEGKANLLKKRAALDTGDPNFRALAVLDERVGTFLVGLDAQYKKGDTGQLIDIRAGAEAFFSLHDSSAWHLYLGQRDPRDKRIRAQVFHLFEADAYFMLDAHQLQLGASIGYVKQWKFGPLKVKASASIEGAAVVSWSPNHLHGELLLQGEAGLSVWGFGANLSIDASIAADVFQPYHIVGDFKVGIGLPWPLPDFDVDVSVEWGPEPVPPPLPVALREIAVEHLKVTTSWPLPRGTSILMPADDRGDGTYPDDPVPAANESAPPPDDAPVVPLDSRPHMTFGRPVNDDALVGVNPQPPSPEWERIGDPALQQGPLKVRYAISEVALHRWDGAAWHLVARKASTSNPGGEPTLYGSWAPTPGNSGSGADQPANSKLWLWSKTPFDYTRHGGSSWDESFGEQFPLYPCQPPPRYTIVACILDHEPLALHVQSPWRCLESPGIVFTWTAPRVQSVVAVAPPILAFHHALCFDGAVRSSLQDDLWIELPESTVAALVVVRADKSMSGTAYRRDGTSEPLQGGNAAQPWMMVFGDLERVALSGNGHFCLAAVYALVGPSADQQQMQQTLLQHLRDETARWSQTGEVLQPHTDYRLKAVTTVAARGEGELSGYSRDVNQTALAYFRTEGPPGLTTLSVPVGHPDPAQFDSGLSTLAPYTAATIPPTLVGPGEKPTMPRPVYRGYDIGAAFNEDYVDLMYRLERRDLGLYLFDVSNAPVREADGRLAVLENRWGRTEQLALDESETRWVATLVGGGCAIIDVSTIPHDPTVTAVAPVRAPDTVYEARLIPLLLHEDFSAYPVGTVALGPAGTIGDWTVIDQGSASGPSRWEVRLEGAPPTRSILQTSNIWGGTVDAPDPVKPGTMLLLTGPAALPADHPDRPVNWTDYRLTALLRASDDDAIGLVFRYKDAAHYYRFSFDRERHYRRLVRVVDGVHTVLADDDFVYRLEQDYEITVEAIGPSLRVYQDGAAVFAVEDLSLGAGTIGLYCWAQQGARFSDIRIDDYRQTAPAVYRFQFTTSRFVDFFHQLHSGDDVPWLENGSAAALLSEAVSPSTPPGEAESRAFENLIAEVFGPVARPPATRVELTALGDDGDTHALLADAAEPIDWRRTDLLVERAAPRTPFHTPAGTLKLTGVEWGAVRPNQESVTLLLRDAVALDRARIEWRQLPAALSEPQESPLVWEARLDQAVGGTLFSETFGPNALDHYELVDQGPYLAPSHWSVTSGALRQTSNIYGGDISRDALDKPGALALTGDVRWTDVHVDVTLRSDDDDAIGLVFRAIDPSHYYRFSMDRERSYRRLVKNDGGVFTLLWEDSTAYTIGRSYRLAIDASGGQLIGRLDGELLFIVDDKGPEAGRVGLYAWANTGAQFEALDVRALTRQPLLWRRQFDGLDELDIVDADGAIDGASQWQVDATMALVQKSPIRVEPPSPSQGGTFALAGDETWRNIELHVRLRSDEDGAIGVLFCARRIIGTSDYSYYRFSMDRRAGGYRRLTRHVGSSTTILWQKIGMVPPPFDVGRSHRLAIRAVGATVTATLDGVELFSIVDDALPSGRIGFYTSGNAGARFEEVLIIDQTVIVGDWEIHDESGLNAPSRWTIAGGVLSQRSAIGDGTPPTLPGTLAIAGDASWADVRIRVDLRTDDPGALGVAFRCADADNCYRFSIDPLRTVRRLTKRAAGVTTVLWVQATGDPVGEPIPITIDAVGPRLTGYIGNNRIFDVRDDTHATGRVGLYCAGNPSARFERIRIERPPLSSRALFRDRFMSGDVTDWSFVDEGTLAGPSIWTVVDGALRQTSDIFTPPIDRDTLDKRGALALAGDAAWTNIVLELELQSLDDDAIGVVFRHAGPGDFYRFSMDSQRGYRRLVRCSGGMFTVLWEDTAGYEVGHAYRLTVTAVGSILRGWLDGIPLFYVADTAIAAGKIGLYAWGNRDVRFSGLTVFSSEYAYSDWLLDETFDLAIPDRWQFIDRTGDPSNWIVTDDELVQTADGGTADETSATLALWSQAVGPEFRLEVDVVKETPSGVGIVFAYLDEQRYHLFQLGPDGRQVLRVAGGTTDILWQDEVPLRTDRMGLVTVDAIAGELRLFLDGIPLVTVEDAGTMAGRIGVASSLTVGTRVGGVRVALPRWALYHEFDRDLVMPAGARVRLHAGNAADAPPADPGVIPRFAASLDDAGRLRLPGAGAELRLTGPDKRQHLQRFLPEAAYSPIAVNVIRKGDDTAFWMTAAPEPLPPGEYHLILTYRRDNRPTDSLILSENGVQTPEEVTVGFSLVPVGIGE